jgi:hypothetical protein
MKNRNNLWFLPHFPVFNPKKAGPLFFILFINDITTVIRTCNNHLYADDVQIYTSYSPSDYKNCVEKLEHIHQWSLSNGLFVNPGKSQAMVVNRRSLRFDDILMNDEMTWDDQVSKVCRTWSLHSSGSGQCGSLHL